MGEGYPKERAEIMAKNRNILNDVKKVTHADMLTILKNLDQDLLKGAVSGPKFKEFFYPNCKR